MRRLSTLVVLAAFAAPASAQFPMPCSSCPASGCTATFQPIRQAVAVLAQPFASCQPCSAPAFAATAVAPCNPRPQATHRPRLLARILGRGR